MYRVARTFRTPSRDTSGEFEEVRRTRGRRGEGCFECEIPSLVRAAEVAGTRGWLIARSFVHRQPEGWGEERRESAE